MTEMLDSRPFSTKGVCTNNYSLTGEFLTVLTRSNRTHVNYIADIKERCRYSELSQLSLKKQLLYRLKRFFF